jgi:hypothetical protein
MMRLERETNPSPGFGPNVLPQHEKVDGAFVKTGEANPLPSRITGGTERITNAALAASTAYTQAAQDRFGKALVSKVRGFAYADQAGTLYIEESDNNVDWSILKTISVTANTLINSDWASLTKRYYRLRYVNGATAQTTFNLYQELGAGVIDTLTQLTGSNAVNIKDSNGTSVFASSAVGDNNPGGFLAAGQYGFNGGTTWDRWRNNTEGTLLASAARTLATKSAIQTNFNAKGVQFILDVTGASGTGGLRVYFGAIDPVTGKEIYLNPDHAFITATGIRVFELYPGASGSGFSVTQRVSGSLPRKWFAYVYHGDATSYTYSVGYSLIL